VLTNDFLYEDLLRVLSQIEYFYFISSEARKEPEDLTASVDGVAVLAPVARVILPLVFHFPFASNFLFVESGLGEASFRRNRLLLLLDLFGSRQAYLTFTSSFGE
jgi:hypothetical protein